MRTKRKYKVYRVETYFGEGGETKESRYFAGETYAVSQEKACCNIEYRTYGKALYGGGYTADLPGDACVDIRYEALEV